MRMLVTDIKRLSVRPGEILLVRVPPEGLTPEVAQQMRRAFQEALPAGVKVIIASDDISVEAIAALEHA